MIFCSDFPFLSSPNSVLMEHPTTFLQTCCFAFYWRASQASLQERLSLSKLWLLPPFFYSPTHQVVSFSSCHAITIVSAVFVVCGCSQGCSSAFRSGHVCYLPKFFLPFERTPLPERSDKRPFGCHSLCLLSFSPSKRSVLCSLQCMFWYLPRCNCVPARGEQSPIFIELSAHSTSADGARSPAKCHCILTSTRRSLHPFLIVPRSYHICVPSQQPTALHLALQALRGQPHFQYVFLSQLTYILGNEAIVFLDFSSSCCSHPSRRTSAFSKKKRRKWQGSPRSTEPENQTSVSMDYVLVYCASATLATR